MTTLEEERCPATEAGHQCVLENGHEGPHVWEDVQALEASRDQLLIPLEEPE